MTKGRKPQPDEIRQLRGNPGKRAGAPVSEDELPASRSDAPQYLVTAAQEIWDDIAPSMLSTNLLRQSDRAVLAMCCDQMAQYWQMSDRIRDDGYVIEVRTYANTDKETIVKRAHPLLKAQKDCAATIKDLVDRLGLSPMSRTQLMAALAGRLPPAPADANQPGLPGTADQPVSANPDDPLNFAPASAAKH